MNYSKREICPVCNCFMSDGHSCKEIWDKIPTKFKVGELHFNWQGGISFEPYGIGFNEQLKETVRKRDNYRCQECFRHQNELDNKLSIHHIDFDKKNNELKNLISLCNSCHGQTNFNGGDWTSYFEERMKESGY